MYHYEEYRILDNHNMAVAKASDKILSDAFFVLISSEKMHLQYKYPDFVLKCFPHEANGIFMPK